MATKLRILKKFKYEKEQVVIVKETLQQYDGKICEWVDVDVEMMRVPD